ncbi:hypothetical protein Tco_1407235 [Tanacetum coccineum]
MEKRTKSPSPVWMGFIYINRWAWARLMGLSMDLGWTCLLCNSLVLEDRKAHLLKDKQIPSVGVFDVGVYHIWKGIGRITGLWYLTKKRTSDIDYTNILKNIVLEDETMRGHNTRNVFGAILETMESGRSEDAQRRAMWLPLVIARCPLALTAASSSILSQDKEKRRGRLDLAKIVDSMRRGWDPRGDVYGCI